MLLIFDIDDTLIDTSGSIVPPLLLAALKKLKESGLDAANIESAYEMLRCIDSVSLSSEEALSEFVELIGGSEKDFLEVKNILYHPVELPMRVDPVDSSKQIVEALAKHHALYIVSKGTPAIQKEKLKKIGLSQTLFEKICIIEEGGKDAAYQAILQESGVPPSKIAVIGDRISRDLTPAKKLGMMTVHMKWGRGLGYTGRKTDVDYTIVSLEELQTVLAECCEKND